MRTMDEVQGERLIFRLFVALAIATAAALLWMAQVVEPQFRTRIYVALAADLLLPVVAWYLLRAIGRMRKTQGEAPEPPRQPQQP